MNQEMIAQQDQQTEQQNIVEELEIVETRELQIGHAFHMFNFS